MNSLKRMWKEAVMAQFKSLSWHLFRGHLLIIQKLIHYLKIQKYLLITFNLRQSLIEALGISGFLSQI
jgi:hypothetical protein